MHSHSAGCHCEPDDGEKFSLYRFINVPGLLGLNAVGTAKVFSFFFCFVLLCFSGSCAKIFRPEHEKALLDVFVESDDDDELIIVVPFSGSVRLRKIVFGAAGESCPTECRIFKNVEVTFDNCHDVQATQVLKLGDDPAAELELSVLAPKFNDCRVLSLFFPSSRGGDKVT